MRIELLSRQGCHLCEDVAEDLTRLGIEFATIDVDQDEGLERRYGDAVPVIMVEGKEVARAPITPASLRSSLASAGVAQTGH
jgi:glutaredoxin